MSRPDALRDRVRPDAEVYRCTMCADTGFATGDDGRVRRCACRRPQAALGIPAEFRDATFATYRTDVGNAAAALAMARAFDAGGRDLYLVGEVGSGKSRLAASIANEWAVAHWGGAWFVRVPWLLRELQPSAEPSDVGSRVERAPLLVLDDVGAERDQATDFTRRTLLLLYEARSDAGLRTVFTSNKTLADLSAMQEDDRLASRIGGRAEVFRLTAPDQRLAWRAHR